MPGCTRYPLTTANAITAEVGGRRSRGGFIGELRTLLTTAPEADGDPDLEVDLLRRIFSIGIVRPMDVARLDLRVTR